MPSGIVSMYLFITKLFPKLIFQRTLIPLKMAYEQLLLDNQFCFRLYTASRLLTQVYTPLLNRLGITYPQYLVLMVLWENDHQPVNDIAKRLRLNTNTITPLLKRMEAERIVRRVKGKIDRRQVIVSLTEHGRALQELAANVPEEMGCRIICEKFSMEDLLSANGMLDVLITHLAEQLEQTEG